MPLSDTVPLVIVKVQNVVDKSFTHRLQKYCNYIYDNYNGPYDYWAEQHFIMMPYTIEDHLSEPLHPLVALEYVFMKQQCFLLGLGHKNDPTVKLLYSVAKEALDCEVHLHEATVDMLANVCTQTQKQFKQILKVMDEDGPLSKQAHEYASAGVICDIWGS
ncbi:hypothetical protein DFQ28_000240 [Apophysomyces sp. BC1034]|nr:hypothetical protein DFQ28_000240 [Apophysomyces sp. BC1034]